MDRKALTKVLKKAVESGGSQRKFAEEHKMSLQLLNDTINERREPGDKILKALGLRRVVVVRYERNPHA